MIEAMIVEPHHYKMNVDPKELEKFSKAAAQWWDPTGPCKPLHALNPIRFQFIQNHCELGGKKVLDIGCGGGILTESIAKADAQASGLDLGEDVIMVAKMHALESQLKISYFHESVETHAESHPQAYEVITCMEMLEHVPEPASIIKAIAKLLKPGGIAFFSTLNRTPKSFLFAILGAEYILNMLPKGTHHYEKFIKPSELFQVCRSYHLSPIATQGIKYNPLRQSFEAATDINVNYLACFQKQ